LHHAATVPAGIVPAVADDVLYEVDGRVGRITINRPDRRNALNSSVLAGLRAALAAARADEQVRVVVLTGAGDRAFSAGADLIGPDSPAAGPSQPPASPAVGPETASTGAPASPAAEPPGASTGPSPSELHEARRQLAEVFGDLSRLGKPSIARVRGYALAGGMGLALACDLVVAAADAVFGTPEIDIGIWPYMVTVVLLQWLPPKRALELMMTGRRIKADEAESLGLVTRVVAVDELDAAVDALAATLAEKPPHALAAGRASFERVLHLAASDALAYLHPLLTVATQTEEAAEGRAAFAERRPPRWATGGPGRPAGSQQQASE